jgi:hypothetical protein
MTSAQIAELGEVIDIPNDPLGTTQKIVELPPVLMAPAFVDLSVFLSGDFVLEKPNVAEVLPGRSLFYAGRLNEIHGEPGEGKTNVAIAAMNIILAQGGSVLYIDPEDTPQGFVNRALGLGGDGDAIRERVYYLHNPAPEEILAAQVWSATNPTSLVVLDGMAEALSSCQMNEDSNPEVLDFLRSYIRPFAEAGCAVLILDHVAKSQESRGRFARGAGSKLGRYDGAVYQIELGKAYTPDVAGFVRLKVSKDRNGGIGVPRGQVAFELHFQPMGDETQVQFVQPNQSKGEFLPTCLMEKVSRWVELNPGGVSANQIEKSVQGNTEHKRKAIFHLLDLGYLNVEAKGRAHLHFHAKPFLESEWKREP